jgi:hypothetical protein
MSPQRPDLVLAADIPDVELCVFVRDRLDVEADRGDGGDVLVELELVEDGCTRQYDSMDDDWNEESNKGLAVHTYSSFRRHPGPA